MPVVHWLWWILFSLVFSNCFNTVIADAILSFLGLLLFLLSCVFGNFSVVGYWTF